CSSSLPVTSQSKPDISQNPASLHARNGCRAEQIACRFAKRRLPFILPHTPRPARENPPSNRSHVSARENDRHHRRYKTAGRGAAGGGVAGFARADRWNV